MSVRIVAMLTKLLVRFDPEQYRLHESAAGLATPFIELCCPTGSRLTMVTLRLCRPPSGLCIIPSGVFRIAWVVFRGFCGVALRYSPMVLLALLRPGLYYRASVDGVAPFIRVGYN
jgi:hypothetical protein